MEDKNFDHAAERGDPGKKSKWDVRLTNGEYVDGRIAVVREEGIKRLAREQPVECAELRNSLLTGANLSPATKELLVDWLLIPSSGIADKEFIAVAKSMLLSTAGSTVISDPFDREDAQTVAVLNTIDTQGPANLTNFLSKKIPGSGFWRL